MKTYVTKISEIKRQWHLVDANDEILGRLATRIAGLLMGKHKPTYSPNLDTGDFVVVINAEKVRVTGNKEKQKLYIRHSGYPGGLKSTSFDTMMEIQPTRAIEYAVKGMLPRNRLGRAMIKKLKVYAGDSHPYQAQLKISQSMVNDKEITV
jgi:large subunit ribosomal protein L13